jgi:hypothetical protein
VLHVLETPDALCLIKRLRQRNAERIEGLFWWELSAALFHEAAKYYVPPSGTRGPPHRALRRGGSSQAYMTLPAPSQLGEHPWRRSGEAAAF